MQAYKFDTRISENGTVSLPFEKLFNKEVEIIVYLKPKSEIKIEKEKKYSAMDFVREFSGCLKNLPDEDPDDLKYEYLRKKYHINNDASEEEIEYAKHEYLKTKYL